jgi:integrase
MIQTFKEATDYTFKTRRKWRVGSGGLNNEINYRHIARIVGDDFMLKDFNREVVTLIEFSLEDYGLADATINRVFSTFKTVFNHCNRMEVIDTPCPYIARREECAGRPYYFTKQQVDLICEEENSAGQADLVRFASLTGGRIGEILKLQVKDVDLDAGLVYFGGRPEFRTKNGDWRTVPIHTHLREMLHQRTNLVPKDVCIFGDQWVTRERVLRKFKQRTRDVGIEPLYVFHCLRHSFATWHCEAGTPIRVLMDLMGHKKIETTLRYAKATDKAREEAMSSFLS